MGFYALKLNIFLLIKRCIDGSDAKIVQNIHDFLMKSLLKAIFQSNFSKKVMNSEENGEETQEKFKVLALESLNEWGLKYKSNIFLGNFRKTWNIIVEDLMIEIPEKLIEKSSLNIENGKNYESFQKKNSIIQEEIFDFSPISGNSKKNQRKDEKISTISEKINEFNQKLDKFQGVSNKKISFSSIFNEKDEKIMLKGFSKEVFQKEMENSKKKISFEAGIIKENVDLKAKVQEKQKEVSFLRLELSKLQKR